MKKNNSPGSTNPPKSYRKKRTSAPEVSTLIQEAQATYAARVMGSVIAFMGMSGKKNYTELENEADFIEIIRKGVPKKVLDFLMLRIGMTTNEMAGVLHVSERTLRRHSPQTVLNQEQSERLIELARLYSRGEEVFTHIERFKEWMNSTITALGKKKPKEFLDTSIGIGLLMDELGRIEHGVYA